MRDYKQMVLIDSFDLTLKWYLKANSVFQLNNGCSVVDPRVQHNTSALV